MNDAGGAALLRYIAQVRDRKLAEIHGHAAQERQTLLAAARRRAREQVRRALRDARQDADARIGVARAASQGRLRRARHERTCAAVAAVWPRLVDAVRQRWQCVEGRRAWIAMALAEAERHLPTACWTVSLPPGPARGESEAEVAAVLERRPGVTLEFTADPALDAGLRIASGAATLDASTQGLLRARTRVEGLWLAALARQAPP